MVDEEVRRLARLLEALVKVEKVPVRELERRLDLGGGTLNRIFNGRIELKVRHVLLVLEALGVKPLAFFEQAYKAPEGEEETAAWLLDAVERLRRRPAVPRPEPEPLAEEDVRRILVDVLKELGMVPPARGEGPPEGPAPGRKPGKKR